MLKGYKNQINWFFTKNHTLVILICLLVQYNVPVHWWQFWVLDFILLFSLYHTVNKFQILASLLKSSFWKIIEKTYKNLLTYLWLMLLCLLTITVGFCNWGWLVTNFIGVACCTEIWRPLASTNKNIKVY